MLRALRQPRYAALSVLMVVVAAICVSAGTWQIARLQSKAKANQYLRDNAHAAVVPVSSILPLVSTGAAPSALKVRFRTVTAIGSFDAERSSLVRERTVDGITGYLVETPLRTADGALLTVRGFLPATASGGTPTPPAPPTGQVSVTARVQSAETRNDQAARLNSNQIESINPTEQAARLHEPVYFGYVELFANEPGVGGLTPIPSPDLSNPAGGAIEPQHVAYIIQWYLFALLALSAPVVMVRAETRHHDMGDIDEPTQPRPRGTEASPEQVRAAKLADRYGRAVR